MKTLKKILSVFLCLVMLMLSLSTFANAEGETEIILGDVDGNGKVETVDARAILRVAASIESVSDEFLSRGDMNSDGAITLNDAVLALRQAVSIGGVVIPDKNGDNQISFDSKNEFIKLISEKYSLDPDSLVAIFSVPDTGVNYVLRFKGASSLFPNKGPFEKSVDNLYYVYQIGMAPEREISYTNGQLLLGDHYNCEAAEGVLVFNLVQTMVMEQYPEHFGITEK